MLTVKIKIILLIGRAHNFFLNILQVKQNHSCPSLINEINPIKESKEHANNKREMFSENQNNKEILFRIQLKIFFFFFDIKKRI